MKSSHLNKRPSPKWGIGQGLCLTLICLLIISSAFLLFAGPVQAALFIITSPLLPNGQVGSSYYASLTATGDNPPFTWSVTSGSLPPGLSLAASGVISGSPTQAGNFNFTATVTDSIAATASQPFIINVSQPPIRFYTTTLGLAKEGESYSETVSVSGGTTPYTWSISSGTLPTGLTLLPTSGHITGTPANGTAGTYSFIVEVTDSSATPLTGTQSFSLIVEKGGYEAVITISEGLKAGETQVYVSGTPLTKLQGGESTEISIDVGISRSISVDSVVEHPTEAGIRFKVETDRITVSESSSDANFRYYPEYYIELKTEPSKVGQLSGGGWYKEDYNLRVSAPDEVNDPNAQGTQYRFAYWKLPTGETISGKELSLVVSAAGSCTAYYDTYYRLILTSPYGEAEGSDWYKAGSTAEWNMTNPQVRIPGILGVFGGKLNAVNSSGTTPMDSPKTVTIDWEPDYTMPFIMIPLTIVLLILGGYGLYLLLRSLQPKPVPPPPPYYPYAPPPPPQPIQPPPTTVVMIGGDKPKLGPASTREQLMEKFGELLERYEDEIKTSLGAEELPEAKTIDKGKRLSAPKATPPPPPPEEEEAPEEEETTQEEEPTTCSFSSKKPLRTVASSWKQLETKTAPPSIGEEATEGTTGLTITWTRNIYQEWEIFNCWQPQGHPEPHEGSVEIVYSLINTITEESTYAAGQELQPPAPHYTDGMPLAEVADSEIVSADKLPHETTP